MDKRIQVPEARAANSGFGERLCALRKAAGFTQAEPVAALGISQRMVASYEKRQVRQLIDAFIERGQLKRKVESHA